MLDNKKLIAHIEEIIKEQLLALGVDFSNLQPHEISQNLFCAVASDKSMLYSWKDEAILQIIPEDNEDGSINWRMFSRT